MTKRSQILNTNQTETLFRNINLLKWLPMKRFVECLSIWPLPVELVEIESATCGPQIKLEEVEKIRCKIKSHIFASLKCRKKVEKVQTINLDLLWRKIKKWDWLGWEHRESLSKRLSSCKRREKRRKLLEFQWEKTSMRSSWKDWQILAKNRDMWLKLDVLATRQ